MAPALVDSEFALAPPEIPARILLNGKEGPVGLMPPLGATLSDDDLAAVLTYVRREWGQTGSPVEPAAIRQVRSQVAGRQQPWTNDELEKLLPAPGPGQAPRSGAAQGPPPFRNRNATDQGRNLIGPCPVLRTPKLPGKAGTILAGCLRMDFLPRSVRGTAMPHPRSRSTSLVRRVFVQALILSAIPVAGAFAQEPTYIRVTSEQANVRLFRNGPVETVMRAPRGTVLEVMHTRGDRFVHRDDNWYWVLLPGDSWNTQRMGWLPGSDVEHAPAPPRPTPRPAEPRVSVTSPRSEAPMMAVAPKPAPAPVAAPVEAPKPVELAVSEVLLHFAFDKSDLSAEARARLDDAMATLKAHDQGGVSFALEGHADWTGPEGYNEKLGQARAETVKQYLAAQHKVAPDKISVASYGENQPAASNDTSEGRAQNRRVVVKVTP